MNEDVYDFNPEGHEQVVQASTAEAVAAYDAGIKALTEALEGKDDAHMMAMWTMKVNGNEVMQMPRACWRSSAEQEETLR